MIHLELTEEEFKIIRLALANSLDLLMEDYPKELKAVIEKFTELLKENRGE